MQWLTPMTGAILAASVIPPLVLLYFLKLRRRTQRMACTILWQRSVEDLRANAPFQRLRFNLLLLLQLLALILLALSVMQPQILGGRLDGGRTIMLIDVSASMAATDVSESSTRFEEAKRLASERIESLYGGGFLDRSAQGETMIIAFSDRAEVVSPFSASKGELLDAIDRLVPTHGQSKLGEALKLARAYATNVDPESDRPVGDPATLELFSDGRVQDLDDQVLMGGEKIDYFPIGEPDADNVAVGVIDVKRPYDQPGNVEVFAAFLNFNLVPLTCDIQLSVDGDARSIQEISIPAAQIDASTGALAAGRNNIVFTPFPEERGVVIEVANLRDDVLMADNVAQIVVPPPKRLRVALVPPSSRFLRDALEGMSLEAVELLTMEQLQRRAAAGGLDAYDVIIVDGVAIPADVLTRGRFLTFGPTPPVSGFNEFGTSGPQLALNAQSGHPVLRFVVLDDLRVFEAQLIEPGEEVEVLVEGSSGPLMLAASRGPLQLIHVPFMPSRSTWPILRSWIPFVMNAVEYLGNLGEGLASRTWSVSEAYVTRLPASARNVTLHLPDGTTDELSPADPTTLSWGPIRLAGLYLLTYAPEGGVEVEQAFAVNVDAEAEGEIGVRPELTIGQQKVEGVSADATTYTPLWPYAVGFCLVVLLLEWWVYHRKTYV